MSKSSGHTVTLLPAFPHPPRCLSFRIFSDDEDAVAADAATAAAVADAVAAVAAAAAVQKRRRLPGDVIGFNFKMGE